MIGYDYYDSCTMIIMIKMITMILVLWFTMIGYDYYDSFDYYDSWLFDDKDGPDIVNGIRLECLDGD